MRSLDVTSNPTAKAASKKTLKRKKAVVKRKAATEMETGKTRSKKPKGN